MEIDLTCGNIAVFAHPGSALAPALLLKLRGFFVSS
jgi:hypothetical protein